MEMAPFPYIDNNNREDALIETGGKNRKEGKQKERFNHKLNDKTPRLWHTDAGNPEKLLYRKETDS